MEINEVCPNCGSGDFDVARDMIATRFCTKCNAQWVPPKPQPKEPKWTSEDRKVFEDAVAACKVLGVTQWSPTTILTTAWSVITYHLVAREVLAHTKGYAKGYADATAAAVERFQSREI